MADVRERGVGSGGEVWFMSDSAAAERSWVDTPAYGRLEGGYAGDVGGVVGRSSDRVEFWDRRSRGAEADEDSPRGAGRMCLGVDCGTGTIHVSGRSLYEGWCRR